MNGSRTKTSIDSYGTDVTLYTVPKSGNPYKALEEGWKHLDWKAHIFSTADTTLATTVRLVSDRFPSKRDDTRSLDELIDKDVYPFMYTFRASRVKEVDESNFELFAKYGESDVVLGQDWSHPRITLETAILQYAKQFWTVHENDQASAIKDRREYMSGKRRDFLTVIRDRIRLAIPGGIDRVFRLTQAGPQRHIHR